MKTQMYKIVQIIDKNFNPKPLPAEHGDLIGKFVWDNYTNKIEIGYPCFFLWNDNSGKMMRTSRVEEVLELEYTHQILVTTQNSVYLFTEVD